MARRRIDGLIASAMTVLAWAVGLLIFFPILWTLLTSFKIGARRLRHPAEVPVLPLDARELRRGAGAFELSRCSPTIRSFCRSARTWSASSSPCRPPGRWPSRRRSLPSARYTRKLYSIMLAAIAAAAILIAWLTSATAVHELAHLRPVVAVVGLPVISWIMTRRTTDVLMWMLSTKMMPGVGVLVPIYPVLPRLCICSTRGSASASC